MDGQKELIKLLKNWGYDGDKYLQIFWSSNRQNRNSLRVIGVVNGKIFMLIFIKKFQKSFHTFRGAD